MMFVCYSLALAILGFGFEYPDVFLMIVLLVAARYVLRSS